MTRRSFDTEDGYRVNTGWDRMLQHFFLDVSRTCLGCDGTGSVFDQELGDSRNCKVCHGEGEEVVYDNLNDDTLTLPGRGMRLNQVRAKLNELFDPKDTPIVLSLVITRIITDRARNAGNDVEFLGTYGRLKDAH